MVATEKLASKVDSIVVDRLDDLGCGVQGIITTNPTNDYDGFVAAPNAVIFRGRMYGKSCFDTDRGWLVYRTDRAVALIA